MATELSLLEGLHYVKGHAMDGATVYAFLVYGETVGAGSITSASTLSGLNEENGTGYARQAVSLGADALGIQTVPATNWNPGVNTNWHSNVSAYGIASASSGGVAIFVWDLISGPFDMSQPNSVLSIPSVEYFFENPGGI